MSDIMIFPTKDQETTVNFGRGDEIVEVYTSDSTMITKLEKLNNECDIITTDGNGRITSAIYYLNIKQVLFRNVPKKKDLGLTDEEKLERGRKLAASRTK